MSSIIDLLNQIAVHLHDGKRDDGKLFAGCKQIFENLENFDWVDSKNVTFAIETLIDRCAADLETEIETLIKNKVATFQQLVNGCGRDVESIDVVFQNYEQLLELKVAFNNISVNNCVVLETKDAERFGIKNAGKICRFNGYDAFRVVVERRLFNVVARKFQTFDNVTADEVVVVSRYVK